MLCHQGHWAGSRMGPWLPVPTPPPRVGSRCHVGPCPEGPDGPWVAALWEPMNRTLALGAAQRQVCRLV